MRIFVPKAKDAAETRTPLSPESARKLIRLGFSVSAEAGHGLPSGYVDEIFAAAGVELISDPAAGRAAADVIFSIEKPSPAELDQMGKDTLFLGLLDPFNRKDLVQAAATAGIRAVSMEMIPRTTLAQKMDVLSSQANLAGYFAVIRAADRLNKILPMMMTPAGTIAPSKVFIIGVGVAGLQAIATAKRLGSRVFAFDTRPVVEEQVKSLGAKFVKIDLGETGQTEQGYARELTPEQIKLQQEGMAKICSESDIVITTAKLFGRPAPLLVTEEMIGRMQPGSIIVDLAAETGGNVAGTIPDQEIMTDNGVMIIGVSKLENLVPQHASQMIAANMANFVEHFWDQESEVLNLDPNDEIVTGCLLTQDGKIIHEQFK
ncbi:MAG: NAD(P) transhydrogenase subunit alpha [Ardenticatenaceae bacterium]|nr:NAD(P) transhydrogenase subunit alpha [Ardenticatenaceae bacterium]